MPVISKIGTRSWKVRTVFALIYLVLAIGSISMIYPLMLMLSGSMKSNADADTMSVFPAYWTEDKVLLQKYLDSKYNMDINSVMSCWQEPETAWYLIALPKPADPQVLQEYLEWRSQCPFWWLGHSAGLGVLPQNARLFRHAMYEKFHGDLNAFNRAMGVALPSWNSVSPSGGAATRYQLPTTGLRREYLEFSQQRPVEDRVIYGLDGSFWYSFLRPRYSSIAVYNQTHNTHYARLFDVLLTRHAPSAGLERTEWEEFVRTQLSLEFIHLNASLIPPVMPAVAPTGQTAQIEWERELKNPAVVPLDAIEVYGPRQMFEEYVAKHRGVPLSSVEPLMLPVAAADYHDVMAHKGQWRWEFISRNYKLVLDYLALHGNGLMNTFIYCGLAVLTALIVNPLAAYALSRYKLPSTYTILLFCMTTMAFPGEVTMIPSFLLLKHFPLWPVVGGLLAALVTFYCLYRLQPKQPELAHAMGALCMGLLTGAVLIPRLTGHSTVSLLNTFSALVLPGMANGFSIFLLKGFFDSLPKELYEAAEIDGAGEWTKFWTITMSTSTPILAVIALGAFTSAYSAFMMALIIIPDQNMWTMMVWIFQLQSFVHPTVVYASLVIAAIPTFVVFALCQNIIIRGIVVPQEK